MKDTPLLATNEKWLGEETREPVRVVLRAQIEDLSKVRSGTK